MTSTLTLGQMVNEQQGWLTQKLLVTFTTNAEWVLWLLAALSVISIAVMLERFIYIQSRRLANPEDLLLKLAKGDLPALKNDVKDLKGMEAAVLREGLEWAEKGPDSVEEVVNATLSRERPRYERNLSVLGTLGSNAPFIGLFGTVLGIIKAFHDLGQSVSKGAQIQQTVMAGISEALVATAVGLAVAIPAVIGYNVLTRAVKNTTARSTALGHALVGHLRAAGK
ncbi:MAG: MotA/TolQ/ExbB proton channel family protein [Myxococcales bacterium]|nr:MotA/TolQ/ExbB proton channel family protein [Myxococcales bacterium]